MKRLRRRLFHFLLIIFLGSHLVACGASSPETETTGAGNASPFSVNTTTPKNNAQNVPLSSAVTATFSKTVDSSTVTDATVTIDPPVSGAVTAIGAKAMFTPSTSFAPLTDYTVTLTTDITDSDGNALTTSYSWTFTTSAPDTTPPTVTTTIPTNGATNIPIVSKLTMTFSEPIDRTTITTSTISINPPVSGMLTSTATTAVFTPSTSFVPATLYTVTLKTDITDLAGNALTTSYSWSFTTSAPDTTPPTVTTKSPANGATNVSTSSTISATFSEPVNQTTVTNATFTVTPSIAGPVTVNGATAMLAPSTSLTPSTLYTVTLTTGIEDLAGNPLTANITWSFTTASGTTAVLGLEFPRNDQVPDGETVRFKFANPHLNGLPIYGPGGAGLTYIFKVRPKQQTGYYTTFFWSNDDGVGTINSTFLWDNGFAESYYGMHPYPPGGSGGTTHNWEISVDQLDEQNGTVVKNVWYTQVVQVWVDPDGSKRHKFYWNWPNRDAGHLVEQTSPPHHNNLTPPAPALTFGDAPWQPGQEMCSCTLRGIQIYSSLLSFADIDSEIAAPKSTAAGANSIWYLNVNPTPTDISDKSGEGHHPQWVGNLRPTPFTGP